MLDDLAYAADLWNQLLASEIINEQDLADLANARSGRCTKRLRLHVCFLGSGDR